MGRSAVIGLAAVAPALAGCSAIQQPEPIPFTVETWDYRDEPGHVLESEHYRIHTTCRYRPFVNALPGFLETCWQAYAEVVPPLSDPDRKLETYVFQQRWHWERFTEEFAPARAVVYKKIRRGGYSQSGVTVSVYSSQRGTLSILAHEGLHQYLEVTRGPAVPAWLNEGLACYFEAFDVDTFNRPAFTPRRNTLRLPSLRDRMTRDDLIPLKDILATHAGLEIHKPTAQVGGYYAQVWSMVLFLSQRSEDNIYYDGFRLIMEELGTDLMASKARAYRAADASGAMSDGEAIFRAYITEDFEAFDAYYQDFVRDLLNFDYLY